MKQFDMELKNDLGIHATFVPNKQHPVHNWFYYKEGFSKQLVDMLLKEFNITNDLNNETRRSLWVLDPFCGSGTTLLTCKQHSINAVGFDVLPISVFASKVKTETYDPELLKKESQILLKKRFIRPENIEVPTSIKRYFSKFALEDIIFFKREIRKIENEKARNFLLLALINTALKISWAWKDGAVLKIKKHPTPPLRKLLKRVIKRMVKDVILNEYEHYEYSSKGKMNKCDPSTQNKQEQNSSVVVHQGDARSLPIEDNCIDAIITSPPYLNNIDYTKVYLIENWLIENIITQEPPLRSFIGLGKDVSFDIIENIPQQASAYFKDMFDVLKEMFRVCKSNAKIAIIVGNAYLQEQQQAIESDQIITELAEKVGFSVKKIYILNQRAALRNRTEKIGELRESMIILRK